MTAVNIAIANQKGGTGKTTTAHTLGVALATNHGRRVLLVDVDPPASLTGACGVTDAQGVSLAEVIGGAMPGPLAMGNGREHRECINRPDWHLLRHRSESE